MIQRFSLSVKKAPDLILTDRFPVTGKQTGFLIRIGIRDDYQRTGIALIHRNINIIDFLMKIECSGKHIHQNIIRSALFPNIQFLKIAAVFLCSDLAALLVAQTAVNFHCLLRKNNAVRCVCNRHSDLTCNAVRHADILLCQCVCIKNQCKNQRYNAKYNAAENG